jgi:hypothetical protein
VAGAKFCAGCGNALGGAATVCRTNALRRCIPAITRRRLATTTAAHSGDKSTCKRPAFDASGAI